MREITDLRVVTDKRSETNLQTGQDKFRQSRPEKTKP